MNKQIECMRYAGRVNQQAIEWGFSKAVAGTSLKEIDEAVEWYIRQADCKPAFKGYKPHGMKEAFPATCCISPNAVAVHGLPNDYVLQPGDVLTIDVGSEHEGWFVDSARTRIVGGSLFGFQKENAAAGRHLIAATEEILEAQLAIIKDGCNLMSLVEVPEKIATDRRVRIIPSFGGHGIGSSIHADPFIPSAIEPGMSPIMQSVQEKRYRETTLTKGQTYCIEPVVTYGSTQCVTDADGWSVRKKDGLLAAHTERCILVTEDGCEILS